MRSKNTVMHIVGNRPQFIKLAPISREIRKNNYQEVIIHTGQHYDENMSDIFFEELDIPKPNVNLHIGSGTHAQMTAKAMVEIEKVIIEYRPMIVLLYGDTNSTLAAALVCAKLNVPIAHVEAGPRTFDKKNPEECNRIVTDHLSTLLFCPDKISVENLKAEGVTDGVYFTGDVMYDTFLYSSIKGLNCNVMELYGLNYDDFILMTWHRQENTCSKDRMNLILNFIEKIENKIILPLHPRTKRYLEEYDLWQRIVSFKNLIITKPLGYLETVKLLNNCKMVLTDSGGLSKESSFGGAKCLFMLDLKPWPELIDCGWIHSLDFNNATAYENAYDFIKNCNRKNVHDSVKFYGDGHTAEEIVKILIQKKYLQ